MQRQLSRISKKLSRISREAVLRKGSYREFQKRRQLSQIQKTKLSRISSEVDHAMAVIANFKKRRCERYIAGSAAIAIFFCQHIAVRYEKHKRYVSDMCFVYVFARYELFSNFCLLKFEETPTASNTRNGREM